MAEYKFNRWDRALKSVMGTQEEIAESGGRWGDPMTLNREAHELPAEKQCMALDMMEEASPELRGKLAPMWKFCFVQWHIFDAGIEAMGKGMSIAKGLQDESLAEDISTLKAVFEDGSLDQGTTAEKWTWKLLESQGKPGSADAWTSDVAEQAMKVAKEERKEGCESFASDRFDKAFWHFGQGLKMIAKAPETAGSHSKLRGDLLKNKAASAHKLGMNRIALSCAVAALKINSADEKAWYRKSCALDALGKHGEARLALEKAGMGTSKTNEDSSESAPQMLELEPSLTSKAESLIFIYQGVNSIVACDMIAELEAELPGVSIPPTLIYDCPTVADVVNFLCAKIDAGNDQFMRRKMLNTVWRSACKALGRDPVKRPISGYSGQRFTEEMAVEVLQSILRAYEEEEWVHITRDAAKNTQFELRSFLCKLRPFALNMQEPILEYYDFDTDAEGMRALECAIVSVAYNSQRVSDLLRTVRVALFGGADSMWDINMEGGTSEFDANLLQARAAYMQNDPFGDAHRNTNSVYKRRLGGK